jgi:hypothetical protein
MKTRDGFVSNSSSTSFVVTIKKETYDKLLGDIEELGNEHVSMCKNLFSPIIMFGMDLMRAKATTGNMSSFPSNNRVNDEEVFNDLLYQLRQYPATEVYIQEDEG